MKATAGEVYTVYNQYLKRYTACQVAYIAPPDSVSKEPWAVILSLDWVGDALLTAEELSHLRPLYKDFMYWPRELHLLRVPVEVRPSTRLWAHCPPSPMSPAAPTAAGMTAMMCTSDPVAGHPGGTRRAFKEAWRATSKRRSAASS